MIDWFKPGKLNFSSSIYYYSAFGQQIQAYLESIMNLCTVKVDNIHEPITEQCTRCLLPQAFCYSSFQTPSEVQVPSPAKALAFYTKYQKQYRNNKSIIFVGERKTFLVEFNIQSLEIWNIKSLVVFLDCGLDHYLLLVIVHLQKVGLLGVGQVAYAPLKAVQSVLADEDRLNPDIFTALLDLTRIYEACLSSNYPISQTHLDYLK